MLSSSLLRGFLLPLGLLVLITFFVRLLDLDMAFQNLLWNQATGGWTFEKSFWVQWAYGAGVVPALIVGVASLCILLFGIGRPELAIYRKLSGYLLSVLLLGNGLMVNVLFKGFWGRPRPSQVSQFGGEYTFEPVLVIDTLSSGKSFVCGHATMGFFFFAVALAIPRNFLRWRIAMMIFAMVYGLFLGWVRMAHGGHFFSDVIWSGFLMWVVALGLFYVFKLHKGRLFLQTHVFKYKVPIWGMACYAPIIAFGAFLGLLGTPYEKSVTISEKRGPISKILINVEGQVDIKQGNSLELRSVVKGFGMPNSSFRYHSKLMSDGTLEIFSKRKGFFTELRPKLEVFVRDDMNVPVIVMNRGEVLPTALQRIRE